MFDVYHSSLLGIWLMLATIFFQAMVAITAHFRQDGGYVPGVIKPDLDQSSFVFRTHRTFQNSLENIIPLLGMSFLAMFSGYSPLKLSVVVWIYALARIIHMILYYKIVAKRNPSPRSIPWTIGFLAGLYFMIDLGVHLVL
tara:strand:- start:1246 stop:1668 length:423 start_codon:yes stop_codon:yes gene_type:complete